MFLPTVELHSGCTHLLLLVSCIYFYFLYLVIPWLFAPVCLPTCPTFPQWGPLRIQSLSPLFVLVALYCCSPLCARCQLKDYFTVSLAWVSLLFMNTYQPKINSWLLFWLGFPLRLHLAAHFHTFQTRQSLFCAEKSNKKSLISTWFGTEVQPQIKQIDMSAELALLNYFPHSSGAHDLSCTCLRPC